MNWLLLDAGLGEAAFNMALDEALLESSARIGAPVMRFYGWKQAAATFGYFQHFAEVEQATLLRPLIRRPTGGGLVPHDSDWTYSLTFPPHLDWHSRRAEESYRLAHEWIQRAFEKIGVETELATCCKKSIPGQCFVGHEKYDLLWHGRKIAGAAQRRNKLGLLIQGSVQPPPLNLNRANWQKAMCESSPEKAEFDSLSISDELETVAQRLAAKKYSQDGYNRKR